MPDRLAPVHHHCQAGELGWPAAVLEIQGWTNDTGLRLDLPVGRDLKQGAKHVENPLVLSLDASSTLAVSTKCCTIPSLGSSNAGEGLVFFLNRILMTFYISVALLSLKPKQHIIMKNCIYCLLTIGMLASVVACSPRTQTASLEKGFKCVGTEPFWSLQIEKSGIVFHHMDEEPMTYPYRPPQKQAKSQVYETFEGDSKLKIILTEGKCSDGMSDDEYPYMVQVERDGQIYKGCAHPMVQNPVQGQ